MSGVSALRMRGLDRGAVGTDVVLALAGAPPRFIRREAQQDDLRGAVKAPLAVKGRLAAVGRE
jgi:hypothetical protein